MFVLAGDLDDGVPGALAGFVGWAGRELFGGVGEVGGGFGEAGVGGFGCGEGEDFIASFDELSEAGGVEDGVAVVVAGQVDFDIHLHHAAEEEIVVSGGGDPDALFGFDGGFEFGVDVRGYSVLAGEERDASADDGVGCEIDFGARHREDGGGGIGLVDEGDKLDFVWDSAEGVHHCFEFCDSAAVTVDEEEDIARVEFDGFGDSGFECVGGDVDADDALDGEDDVGLALMDGAIPGFDQVLGDAAKHGVIGIGGVENDVLVVFGDQVAFECMAALEGELVGWNCSNGAEERDAEGRDGCEFSPFSHGVFIDYDRRGMKERFWRGNRYRRYKRYL